MPAAFDKRYASRLEGDNVKDCATRWDMVEALRGDIRRFKADNGCERVVVLWAASTEIYVPVDEAVHYRLADLEAAMRPTTRSARALHVLCLRRLGRRRALRDGCPQHHGGHPRHVGTGRKDENAHCRQGRSKPDRRS